MGAAGILALLGVGIARADEGPKVVDDFEVRVVAKYPTVRFPSQVATAPDGRLFVAEDSMDQPGPHEANNGRILQFRDGRGEPTVFAQGLRAVFGMAWHDGALYVSHMPYLSVLRDDDGDGVAESRRDLFKDLGITDNRGLNDHIVSGIQFGIDGKLYISTGDKGVYHANGPDGRTAQVVGGGTLRCNPDGTGIEVLSTGTRNHLEPNLDALDNLFTYDNTDDGDGWWTRVTHHVDGGYYGYPYDYHDHPERFLNRINEYGGGSPCGGLVYREDAWPERYRGRVLWAEWGKRKVQAFRFEPDGATFRVADVIDLASNNKNDFVPIDLALSYDGRTLYVADWAMGGWSSKTAAVGAVYAITPKGPSLATRPRGSDADPLEKQFAQLDHPSYNERMRAQAAILRAGPKVAWNQTRALLVDPQVDPVARRHLVWIFSGLSRDQSMVNNLLDVARDATGDVQAQAIRALGERNYAPAVPTLLALLKADSPSPASRLQIVIALGRIGDKAGAPALANLLSDPDRTVAFSARQALRRIGDWDAVAANLRSPDPKVRAASLAALELTEQVGAVSALNDRIGDVLAPAADRAQALSTLALVARKAPPWNGKWWGTRPTQGKAPARTVDWEATPIIQARIEQALADPEPAVRLAAVGVATDASNLPGLRARLAPGAEADPAIRGRVAVALGRLKDRASVSTLAALVRNPATAEATRNDAVGALESIGGAEAVAPLVELAGPPGDALAEPVLVRVLRALGTLKAEGAVPPLVARLKAPLPTVRAAAAEALGAIGPRSAVAGPIRERLADESLAVRKAALASLGRLGDHDSVPGILPLAIPDATRYEATLALAEIPDLRALAVYLPGLTDKSQTVRKACLQAMVAIRAEAAPVLDRLASRRELSPSAVPELRKVYNQFEPIPAWQILGMLPLAATPPVPPESPVDPAATVAGPDGTTLRWELVRGAAATGAVDLIRHYRHETTSKSVMAAAVVTSPVARSARMQVGCDDTLDVWVNGTKVHAIDGNHSYEPNMAQFKVELNAGPNLVFVKCGNDSGDWKFSAAVTGATTYAFLDAPAAGTFDPDKYRDAALKGKGNADHGRALFADLKGLACAKCHAVDGQGGNIGPNLSGVAATYPRTELIQSILYPSARIFSGYETTIIATADGRVLTGLVRADTPEGVEIEDAEGQRTRLAPNAIEERKTSDLSIMPIGIVEGITAQDFADLVAYLETCRNVAANQGQPPGR